MSIEKNISPLIESQFPSFYQEEGPNFIAFVKAYYEWAEQQDNFINMTRSFYDIKDIDSTPEKFVKYFKNKYISSLPESIISDKKLLVKHILELYRTKGTKRSYELLFRILFNEEITFFIPGDFIFKPSEADWHVPRYIEISNHPLLGELIGRRIYSKDDGFATVESYFVKIVNNQTINVLMLSGLEGNFKFNEQIFCEDFPEITSDNAPIVFGSLSSISITNGGTNFEVGQFLNVDAGGVGGLARVASVREENGKVEFTLVNGGEGFSLDAIVSITGGFGSGANFEVGDITNKKIYLIVRDKIDQFKETALEDPAQGFKIAITSPTGTFINGEVVTSSANSVTLDVQNIDGLAANGESFSNTDLGVSNLIAYKVDGNCIYLTTNSTSDASLTNANLKVDTLLISNSSSAIVKIKNLYPKKTITATGSVVDANTSEVIVNQTSGYFVPVSKMTGACASYTATVSTTERTTDWEFPYAVNIEYLSNLDTPINKLFTIRIFETGTIAYLKNVNPGDGYSVPPVVSVIEPDIYDLKLADGLGGYQGFNSIITTKAGSANGIVTAVEVVDSGYGYNLDQTIYLSSPTNATVVSGTTVVDTNGKGYGYWRNNKSFLSDIINIQDSNYYQNFSYEIVAPRMMETYEKYVRDLIHPSGMKMFGKYALNSYLTDDYTIPGPFSITQS